VIDQNRAGEQKYGVIHKEARPAFWQRAWRMGQRAERKAHGLKIMVEG